MTGQLDDSGAAPAPPPRDRPSDATRSPDRRTEERSVSAPKREYGKDPVVDRPLDASPPQLAPVNPSALRTPPPTTAPSLPMSDGSPSGLSFPSTGMPASGMSTGTPSAGSLGSGLSSPASSLPTPPTSAVPPTTPNDFSRGLSAGLGAGGGGGAPLLPPPVSSPPPSQVASTTGAISRAATRHARRWPTPTAAPVSARHRLRLPVPVGVPSCPRGPVATVHVGSASQHSAGDTGRGPSAYRATTNPAAVGRLTACGTAAAWRRRLRCRRRRRWRRCRPSFIGPRSIVGECIPTGVRAHARVPVVRGHRLVRRGVQDTIGAANRGGEQRGRRLHPAGRVLAAIRPAPLLRSWTVRCVSRPLVRLGQPRAHDARLRCILHGARSQP